MQYYELTTEYGRNGTGRPQHPLLPLSLTHPPKHITALLVAGKDIETYSTNASMCKEKHKTTKTAAETA